MRKTKTKGSGLIFAVILLFVILGAVITLSSITVLETKMSQKTKSSVGAFYNSESGVEWALNQITNGSGRIDSVFSTYWDETSDKASCPFGGCSVYFLKEDGAVIVAGGTDVEEIRAVRSVGSQGDETRRAIEAAVAAGGGGCYTCYNGTDAVDCCDTKFKSTTVKLGYWGDYDGQNNRSYTLTTATYCPPGGPCETEKGTAWVCCR